MKCILALGVVSWQIAASNQSVIYGAQVAVGSSVYIVQGEHINYETKESTLTGLLYRLDTHKAFNNTTVPWSVEKISPNMPHLFSASCTQYESTSPKFLCFGGSTKNHVLQSRDGSPFSYDTSTQEWNHVKFSTSEQPSPRYGHAMITLPDNNIALLGGAELTNSNISDEFWILNSNNIWAKIKTSGISPSFHHTLSIVSDSSHYKLVSIGGKISTSDLVPTKSVLVYNSATRSWKNVSVRSPIYPRHSHSAAVWGKKIIIFGGANHDLSELYSDICSFDTETMDWTTLYPDKKIPGRYGHKATVINDTMLIYFGNSSPSSADMLFFDLKANKFVDGLAIENQEKISSNAWIIGGVVGGLVIVAMIGCLFCVCLTRKVETSEAKDRLNAPSTSQEYQFADCGILELSVDAGLDEFSSFSDGSVNRHGMIPGFTNSTTAQKLDSEPSIEQNSKL